MPVVDALLDGRVLLEMKVIKFMTGTGRCGSVMYVACSWAVMCLDRFSSCGMRRAHWAGMMLTMRCRTDRRRNTRSRSDWTHSGRRRWPHARRPERRVRLNPTFYPKHDPNINPKRPIEEAYRRGLR